MQVKTFRGRSSFEALQQVKQVLGDDAVILGTQNVSEGEKTWCEVTAATDHAAPEKPATGDDPQTGSAPGWNEWHREWDLIKSHMMALIKPQLDMSMLAPRQRQALELLEREGVAEGVSLALYDTLRGDRESSILGALGRIVRPHAWNWKNWRQKLHVLAGPSGCGKSTTLLRMALACHTKRPDSRICIVNLDASGGKARQYLKYFAELSGMAYKDIRNAREMLDLVKDGQKFDRIFVDMPAMSGKTTLNRYLQLIGLGECDDMAVHLVLSPHYAPAQLELFTRKYASSKCASVIWTKLDEACNFGAVVNTAHATGLPVAALSIGSGLRGTLVPADTGMLWRLIFKRQLPESPLEEKRGNYAQ
ncbi:flagellar biosynthesis protein FlhF [Desulfobaculum sp. SPO524]|uniref:flagellar biosynthesis protein FlhF n=1 Tax=Desulfobaculum sp. SPO524 TaxID=3378071 RepID=UPI003852C05C